MLRKNNYFVLDWGEHIGSPLQNDALVGANLCVRPRIAQKINKNSILYFLA